MIVRGSLCALGLVLSGLAVASPLGPAFQVNTYTSGDQQLPGVAVGPDGAFLVVWESLDPGGVGTGIRARLYDAAGTPRGDELLVNALTTDEVRTPAVAPMPDGFVVVWQAIAGSTGTIHGRRLNSDGSPSGAVFEVGPSPPGQAPKLGSDEQGSFVVAWRSADGFSTWARRYPNGVADPPFEAFPGPESGPASASAHDVAMDGSGRFVVAAVGYTIFEKTDVVARFIPTPTPYRYLGYADYDTDLDVAGNQAGLFAMTWVGGSGRGALIDASGLYQLFPVGAPASSKGLRSALSPQGTLTVVWQEPAVSGSIARLRQFGANGTAVATPEDVDPPQGSSQSHPDVALDDANNPIVVWSETLRDGSGQGVFARRFCRRPSATQPSINHVCQGSPAHFHVTLDGVGPLTLRWRQNGQPLADGGGISGATTADLTIDGPSLQPGATYDCTIADACDPPQTGVSTPAQVRLRSVPSAVTGLTVFKGVVAGQIEFRWSFDGDSEDYVVYQDSSPGGGFATPICTSHLDATNCYGVPVPPGNRFFLIAASNPGCGMGPLH